MNRHAIISSIILLSIIVLPAISFSAAKECPSYEVCFTPGQPCEQSIITAISSAKKNVYVQAYSFTSNYIANALIAAHRNSVKVQVILDRSWLREPKKNRAILALSEAGIPIWIDAEPSIAHNKVMVIDDEKVITGSYNFTIAAARYNAENVLIISSAELAEKYADNWEQRRKVSKPLSDYAKEL
jgi:phospholipase D